MSDSTGHPIQVTLAVIGEGKNRNHLVEKFAREITRERLALLESALRIVPIPCNDEQNITQAETEIDRTLAKYPGQTGLIILIDQDPAGVVLEKFERKRKTQFKENPKGSIPYFLIPSGTLTSKQTQRTSTAIEEKEIEAVARRLKGTNGPVLLIGETGTGKTRIARRLHEGVFGRKDKTLLEVNCASLDPTEARMSTFFRGVEHGVYSDVGQANPVFKDIEGGTLFLDEFQELRIHQQAMLLDLLDSFTTTVSGHCVGNNKIAWSADVQVMVAINEPLKDLFRKRKLRKDIYHRLWRRIPLPALRERLEEVGRDVAERELRHKILRMQEIGIRLTPPKNGLDSKTNLLENIRKAFTFIYEEECLVPGRVSLEQMPVPEELIEHRWPGNFRELEALAHMLMDEGVVGNWEGRIQEKFKELIGGTIEWKETQSRQSFEGNPGQLIGKAWETALTRPNTSLPQMARSLGLDPRSIKKRLEYLCDPSGESPCKTWFSFLQELPDVQKEQLVAAARAFLSQISGN
jgi:transcriptional regulator of acetoin/glycerol metabolism